ncbi:MAG: flagellar hook-basal body complex protein, partial [Planctomycetes bacterium]|nr:flagellar hook-basal body complex protein [Planctomycetota bacterium]
MQNSIYLNAAGAIAAQTRMDVIANNIANADTPGFRRGFAVFQQRLAEVWEPPVLNPSWDDVLNDQGGGLFVHEVTYTNETGPIHQTGSQFDLAIEGDGWFPIESDGEVLYTRAGNFARSADGTIVTADGRGKLLDQEGKPIVLPPAVQRFSVEGDGTVRMDDVPRTRIQVLGTLDHRQFTPRGDNLYRYEGEDT